MSISIIDENLPFFDGISVFLDSFSDLPILFQKTCFCFLVGGEGLGSGSMARHLHRSPGLRDFPEFRDFEGPFFFKSALFSLKNHAFMVKSGIFLKMY